jgi:TM2 domain-containing membrane protein YozV
VPFVSGPNGLAAKISSTYADDQILLLDWTNAANAPNISSDEEDWIQPVAAWAAGKLMNYGFVGAKINLIGHSWGGNMADELAERVSGGVNTIVALDPARNGLGDYNPEDSGQINFRGHSQFSWAFHSSWLGSASTPTSADEAVIVGTGLSLVLSLDGPNAHGAVIDVFTHMLANSVGGVSSKFQLSRLLAHQSWPWTPNLFTTSFDQGFPYTETPTSGYEGRIGAVAGGLSPNFLEYRDSSSEYQLVYETADITPPTVTVNQASGQADPTGSSPISFTVVFSEAVTGFVSSDVTLGGTAGATAKVVTGSGTTYNVAVSGMTQSGTITATIPAGAAQDGAGNASLASTSGDNNVTYNAPDITPPTVTINQASGQADSTSNSPINFTVVFSEAVTGFASSDVTLGGTAGATGKSVTGSGTTYNVAVSGMTQSGTVTASIPAGAAQDSAGNANLVSTSSDNSVTYSVADTIKPAVVITAPVNAATYSTISGNLSVGGTASDNVGVTQVTWSNDRGGSGTATGTTNWTVSGITLSSGQNILTITARDAAGNTQTDTLTVTYNTADTIQPVVAITSPTTSPTHITTSGSLNIGGTSSDNVGVTQATWSNDRGGSGTATGTTNWTVSGITLSSGLNVITVTARDAAGNTQTDTLTVTYNPADTVQPSVAIISPTSSSTYNTSSGSLNLGGTASDNVGVTQVTWGNDRGGNGTASGLNSWSVSGIALSSGQNILTVTARDAAGNTQTDTLTVTYNAADSTKPVVTITSPVNVAAYVTTTSSLSLGGTASDAGGITQVTWSNDRGGSGTATGTTSWSVSGINLSAGQNILTISARDATSNIGTDTLTVTYTPPGEHPWKGPVTPLIVDLSDGRYFGIEFNRLIGALGNGIRIEGSANLRDWVDATPSMQMHGSPVANLDGIREVVAFRCPLPMSDSRASGLRFLRLAIVDSRVPVVGKVNSVVGTMGGAVTLNIATSGDPSTSYDWYRDWTLVGKTTAPQFQIPSLSTSSIGTYRVVAHNAYGSATSNPFLVQAGGWTYDSWLTAMVGNGKTPTSPGYGRSESLLGDGSSNILKYAFGTAPMKQVQSMLPLAKLLSSGGLTHLGIEFNRLLTPSDVAMRIEASGNLASWRDVTSVMVPIGSPVPSADGLSEKITFRCPVSMTQVESQNWRYLRVAVTVISSPTVLLSDDFNDGVINAAKWTASGNTVQEQDGYLKLLTNQTDAGGKVYSSNFSMPTNGLTVTRKARVHYSNTYSIPSIRIGYRDGANQEMTVFSIHYGNMSYDLGVQHSVYGTFLGLGQGNPHDDNLRYLTVQGPAVIWDTWFDEKITYDRQSGLVRYSRNGVESITGTAPVMPAGASVYVTMNGWGWNTGHWHHCDDLLIKSGADP